MTQTPMVRAEAVCKNFGALQVLKGINLLVRPSRLRREGQQAT